MKNKIAWYEVLGKDADALRGFYGEMFGWKYQLMEEMNYGLIQHEEGEVGGGVGATPEGPGWSTFYVGTDDLNASIAKAKKLGGKVVMPRTELPDGGVIAVIQDPEGHPVGLVQPAAK